MELLAEGQTAKQVNWFFRTRRHLDNTMRYLSFCPDQDSYPFPDPDLDMLLIDPRVPVDNSIEAELVTLERGFDYDVIAEFKRFHKENSHVMTTFEKCALERLDEGFRRYSATLIVGHMRYVLKTQTSALEFTLNDDHTAIYARLAVIHHPELEGFFEFRHRSSGTSTSY